MQEVNSCEEEKVVVNVASIGLVHFFCSDFNHSKKRFGILYSFRGE